MAEFYTGIFSDNLTTKMKPDKAVALHKESGRNIIRKSLFFNRVIVLLILMAAVFAGCDMFFKVSSSAFASDPPDPEVYPCNAGPGIKAIKSVVPESHRWIALKPAPVAAVPIREGLKAGDLVGGPLPEMRFAYAPPGEFMMGIPACEPQQDNVQHKVRLTRGFYIQTTEVTQGQWKAVMGDNPSKFFHCGDNCPVEQVSWDNVQEFIGKLNMKGGREYRLPTEAEWEYAAHAGTTGDRGNLDAVGWYKHNAKNKTHPVAKKKPNDWGIYDMHGNVFEWCQDGDGSYPPENSAIDPAGSPGSDTIVIRGGSFASLSRDCRSVDRLRLEPSNSYLLLGFRLVFSAGQQ